MLGELEDVELGIFVFSSNIFERIDGMPKQVPSTTTHPTTPLKKGNKILFPNPIFDFCTVSFL